MIQLLGKPGTTEPCVQAACHVLTAPHKPKRMTCVTADDGSHSAPVLFLAWEWPDRQTTTIISDGFGTHGGTGGKALSGVLGLIRYMNVPLFFISLEEEVFYQIASGTLSDSLLHVIAQKEELYQWDFYPAAQIERLKENGKPVLEARAPGGVYVFTVPFSE